MTMIFIIILIPIFILVPILLFIIMVTVILIITVITIILYNDDDEDDDGDNDTSNGFSEYASRKQFYVPSFSVMFIDKVITQNAKSYPIILNSIHAKQQIKLTLAVQKSVSGVYVNVRNKSCNHIYKGQRVLQTLMLTADIERSNVKRILLDLTSHEHHITDISNAYLTASERTTGGRKLRNRVRVIGGGILLSANVTG